MNKNKIKTIKLMLVAFASLSTIQTVRPMESVIAGLAINAGIQKLCGIDNGTVIANTALSATGLAATQALLPYLPGKETGIIKEIAKKLIPIVTNLTIQGILNWRQKNDLEKMEQKITKTLPTAMPSSLRLMPKSQYNKSMSPVCYGLSTGREATKRA